MIVILEGPDNAGKTSLAKKIHGPEVTYFHPGGKPDSDAAEDECIDEQLRLMVRANDNRRNWIIDRVTPISQQVYNPDVNRLSSRREAWLLMKQQGPVVIYCRPSNDRLMRKEDFTWRDGETEEHKQKIIQNQHIFIERYDEMMKSIPCVSYDFESDQAQIITTKLRNALAGSGADEAWFHTIMNFRGN